MMMMMMKPQEIFPIQIQMLANLHLVCDGKKASCSFAHFVAYIHKSLFFFCSMFLLFFSFMIREMLNKIAANCHNSAKICIILDSHQC
jgi:hypothetical protein